MEISDKSDKDFVPILENKTDAKNNNARSSGAPELEQNKSEENKDNNSNNNNSDNNSVNREIDNLFKNLALRALFKWSLLLNSIIMGFLFTELYFY